MGKINTSSHSFPISALNPIDLAMHYPSGHLASYGDQTDIQNISCTSVGEPVPSWIAQRLP